MWLLSVNGNPVHFYHLWLGGPHSRKIAEEHFEHVPDCFTVFAGLVGTPERRADAKTWLPCKVIAEADTGFEEVTINALRSRIKTMPNDTRVFYAHNKGAFHNLPANHVWRREMMRYLFVDVQERIKELEDHDIVCWCWSPKGTKDPYGIPITDSISAGNFWGARADYLKCLPEIPPLVEDQRVQAEAWLGQDAPVVKSLMHGWPQWRMGMSVPHFINGFKQERDLWVPNPDAQGF
jgi:hypothetical protein